MVDRSYLNDRTCANEMTNRSFLIKMLVANAKFCMQNRLVIIIAEVATNAFKRFESNASLRIVPCLL